MNAPVTTLPTIRRPDADSWAWAANSSASAVQSADVTTATTTTTTGNVGETEIPGQHAMTTEEPDTSARARQDTRRPRTRRAALTSTGAQEIHALKTAIAVRHVTMFRHRVPVSPAPVQADGSQWEACADRKPATESISRRDTEELATMRAILASYLTRFTTRRATSVVFPGTRVFHPERHPDIRASTVLEIRRPRISATRISATCTISPLVSWDPATFLARTVFS